MNQFMDVSTGLQLANNNISIINNCQQQYSYGYFSLLSQDYLSYLINQQGDELERYLHAQKEEVRRKLADKTQRHYHALTRAANESVLRIIREKEAVAERAARRQAELEARASQLRAEAEAWRAKAAALQAELRQSEGEVVDAESTYVDPERVVVSRLGCKACGKRVASVVVLPCRHLCVCSECDDVVECCPLCYSFRSSSIEVYLS
ncbi:uncharacterized protein LOC143614279 [Bidens hawaiensis]|uniref:uncharacterized protein LOC143614279 n=1 Tax=Bidens hawaiensis TaxID=980011 RepID=UPI00404B6D23